ncbi:hypothetical protein ACFZAC_26130 [Pseudomonas fluorescens]|uniref:hypothetical protein n=1 Tax=Pseudomonas fluorescens TaxID=294 RepID=UPI00374952A5
MHLLAEQHYRSTRPRTGRQNYRRLLQWYSDLVICPRVNAHLSEAALDAQRLLAAQCLIRMALTMKAANDDERLAIVFALPQMAKSAPRDLPWSFSMLDAWRIAVDELHTLKSRGVAA